MFSRPCRRGSPRPTRRRAATASCTSSKAASTSGSRSPGRRPTARTRWSKPSSRATQPRPAARDERELGRITSMKLRRTMLLVVVLFVLPIAISIATHTPAAATWQTASRAPTGLAPDPALVREPVVQVYAARTFGWRGAFGVHSWIAVKRADADTYTRYDVVFWGGPPHVRRNYAGPDALWFGSRPDVLVDRRGEGVEALIDQIEAAVQRYPF